MRAWSPAERPAHVQTRRRRQASVPRAGGRGSQSDVFGLRHQHQDVRLHGRRPCRSSRPPSARAAFRSGADRAYPSRVARRVRAPPFDAFSTIAGWRRAIGRRPARRSRHLFVGAAVAGLGRLLATPPGPGRSLVRRQRRRPHLRTSRCAGRAARLAVAPDLPRLRGDPGRPERRAVERPPRLRRSTSCTSTPT